MSLTPLQVIEQVLANTTNLEKLTELIAPDATYVSLNYYHPNLTSIMPWCGTHEKEGPKAIYQTFVDVNRYWETKDFEVLGCFGSGEDVAVFGKFTYRSRVMDKIGTSPFAIWAKVNDGQVTYMQFMEDTLMTSSTFAESGERVYRSDPDGRVVKF